MKYLPIILICSSIIFIHCASTGEKGFSQYGQSRIIEAEYNDVFQATLNHFRDLGYTIKTTDWDSGKIETDYKKRDRGTFRYYDRRSRIRAEVVKMADNQVKLTLEYFNEVKEDVNSSWIALELNTRDEMAVYDRNFNQITERIQSMK